MAWLTVREAAETLEISEAAVRKRIQRDTLPYRRRSDGRVSVYVPARKDSNNGAQTNLAPQKSADPSNSQEVKGSPANIEATLNHIDKLHQTLSHAVVSRNRVLLIVQILSLLIVTVSAGVLPTEEAFSFSLVGLQLDLSLPVFLFGSGLILAALVTYFYSISPHISACEDEITARYRIIGYDVGVANSSTAGKVEQGDFIREKGRRYLSPIDALRVVLRPLPESEVYDPRERSWFDLFFLTVVISLEFYFFIILLPVLAEIAVVLKIGAVVGWQHFFPWLSSLLVLVPLGALIAFARRYTFVRGY